MGAGQAPCCCLSSQPGPTPRCRCWNGPRLPAGTGRAGPGHGVRPSHPRLRPSSRRVCFFCSSPGTLSPSAFSLLLPAPPPTPLLCQTLMPAHRSNSGFSTSKVAPLEVSSSGQLVVFRELWQVTTAFGNISSAVSFSACAYAGNSGVLPLLSSFYLPPSSPGQDIILEGGGPKFVPMVWEKQFLPFHIKTVI